MDIIRVFETFGPGSIPGWPTNFAPVCRLSSKQEKANGYMGVRVPSGAPRTLARHAYDYCLNLVVTRTSSLLAKPK